MIQDEGKQKKEFTFTNEADSNIVNDKVISLRINFSWTLIGYLVYSAAQWGMIVLIAKFGSTTMVGQFSLGLAISAPFFMFSNLQLRNILATDAGKQFTFSEYFGLRLFSVCVTIIAVTLGSVFGGYKGITLLVIVLVTLTKGFEAISDIIFGLHQRNEMMIRLAKSMVMKGLLSLVAVGMLIYTTKSIVIAVIGLGVSWLILLVLYDVRTAKVYGNIQPIFKLKNMVPLIKLSLPMGFVMMLNSLNVNIPRYFIEQTYGEHSLGVFAALSYVIIAGQTVVSSLGHSANPRLSKYYLDRNVKKYLNLLIVLIVVGIVLCLLSTLGALIFGKEFLLIAYGPEYAKYYDAFIWLMAAGGIGYIASFLNCGMTSARTFKVQLPIYLLVCMSTALTSWLLIPKFHLIGGAMALVVSSSILLVGNLLVNVYITIKLFSNQYKNLEVKGAVS